MQIPSGFIESRYCNSSFNTGSSQERSGDYWIIKISCLFFGVFLIIEWKIVLVFIHIEKDSCVCSSYTILYLLKVGMDYSCCSQQISVQ